MRFKYTFNLEPESNKQHRFAVDNLRAWHESEKQREDVKDVALSRRDNFHREIYLSGLYLHQLSEELPRLVSKQYCPEGVSSERLMQQLGVVADSNPHSTQAKANVEADSMILEETQWQRLELMLSQQQQNIQSATNSHSESLEHTRLTLQTALKAEHVELKLQLEEQFREHVAALSSSAWMSEIAELKSQQLQFLEGVEQQFKVLDEGQGQTNKPLPATEHPFNIEASLDTAKTELLAAIETNQRQLLAASNALKKQVASLTHSNKTLVEDVDTEGLNNQLQRASKVKSKGLW